MSSLFIAGDLACRGRVAQNIESGRGILLSKEILTALKAADFSIVNLESPVGHPSLFIRKAGPSLCCSSETLSYIRTIGFNGVTLANNHFFDCGNEGVKKTIDACNNYGVTCFGGGLNLTEAQKRKTLSFPDGEIDIINVCENEFSIATDTHGGANYLDTVRVYRDIIASTKEKHRVIVIIHGGHEYYQLPSPRMQELYRFFIDVGASAVINHHQHCYSGFEVYNGRPIFYGLGNFYFDSARKVRNSIWNQGYAVTLEMSDSISFKIHPYIQCDEDPIVRELSPEEKVVFQERLNVLNDIIENPKRLLEEWLGFAKKKNIQRALSPFYNGLTLKLYGKSWFPSLIPLKQKLLQLNYIQCESHRDVLLYKLRSELKLEK